MEQQTKNNVKLGLLVLAGLLLLILTLYGVGKNQNLFGSNFQLKARFSNISGLMKDTVNVMPLDTVAVDFVADNPGDSLLHCHMQLHMDFGFMAMVKYA